MEWGEHLQMLEDAEAEGFDPVALQERPVLDQVQEDILEAFLFLSQRRPPASGFGPPGAIPLPEIESYCRVYEIEDVQEFMDLIATTDIKFLNLLHRD